MITLYLLLVSLPLSLAEDGVAGWLRYAPLPLAQLPHASLPSQIVVLNTSESSPVYTAGKELQAGIQRILSQQCGVQYDYHQVQESITVGTLDQYREAYGDDLDNVPDLVEDGFWFSSKDQQQIRIIGQNERGALYGAFEYLSLLAQGDFYQVEFTSNPAAPIRWTNEWDNMDGSIERGYGGPSIFLAEGSILQNLTRAEQYARLLASIRINGVVVNNVNANSSILTSENIAGLGRIADVFRPYGVQLGLSLNFAAPQDFGGLDTFDPLDKSVVQWWTNVTQQIYETIPDMAGYLVKANSEGQPGPITYNRTLAEGANLFAKAVQPYDGIVMFRAFVYDQLNESNWHADRAKAAVDYFKPLDGQFDDNVVVQIKYGPIDFQVREPASPLFANLRETNTAIELEVTQEYLGQQSHLVYLPPLWKTILDFDLRVDNKSSLVRDVITGKRFRKPLSGFAAVVNVGQGNSTTWLGSHMSMSNLYAYGRLAWDPTLDSTRILQDWIRLTFSPTSSAVLDTMTTISVLSWPAYENYTGNLGLQTLTDILYTHYGPNPASQDNNGWGQWTRADSFSIGMDRTVSNGTGYSGQYPPEVAAAYEDPATTPDDLFLWFHHVNYTTPLPQSGKTVIQHIYDAHYAGAATASTFPAHFMSMQSEIDHERYTSILANLEYQASHSIIWRDAICDFYHSLSGVPDVHGRVGKHPYRVEAEDMLLDNYRLYAVSPFETASNSTAIITSSNSTAGTAKFQSPFPSGKYDIGVNIYDLYGGKSTWELSIGGTEVERWVGNAEDILSHTPSIYLDGHSARRLMVGQSVDVKQGDWVKIVGMPDGVEPAPLDYVVFLPANREGDYVD